MGFLAGNVWLALPPLMAAAVLHYLSGATVAVAGGVVDSRVRATSVAIALIVNLLDTASDASDRFAVSLAERHVLSWSDLGLTLDACKAVGDLTAAEIAHDTSNAADCSGR